MKSRLLKLVERIRTSLWFVPGGLLPAGVGLALLCLAIDFYGKDATAAVLPSYGPSNPAGARAFLPTVAGGLLGIVGAALAFRGGEINR